MVNTMLVGSSRLLLLAGFLAALALNVLGSQHVHEALGSRLNATYAREHPSGLASIFSPRMDFEQWKPLTGRGNPLHNDPTYDYEPPVLERVHYWADDTKPEREIFQEKKSEVLMLGVSSRKPSVTSRQPPLPPPRRHHQFRQPPKYEDYTYKLSETYPMTILVPPPPPPPGHKPSLFILDDKEIPITNTQIKEIISPLVTPIESTKAPEKVTSSYALQEANLIFQSSSTSQNWILDTNETSAQDSDKVVSSDYAGWGPTTPIDVYETANETHNLVSNDHVEISRHPYSFYRPMLSESPPPPPSEPNTYTQFPSFLPTVLPPTTFEEPTSKIPEATRPNEETTTEMVTIDQDYYEDTQTPSPTETIVFRPTIAMKESTEKPKSEEGFNLFSMLSPMMSMPITNERPEDNLYAHASENMQVYKERNQEDILSLENMQTMHPPPPVKYAESTTVSQKPPYHVNSNIISSVEHNKPSVHTHDPYLHMRYTTPVSTTHTDSADDSNKSPTEASAPMYLIIQGHSKVKTYSSKVKPSDDSKHTSNNEILKPNETNEVKHLHPKEKFAKKLNITSTRKNRDRNLKALVDQGLGSIEIQEANLGIKYDVSDGSDVPLELYRKGIVDNVETSYKAGKSIEPRKRRQLGLEDLLPDDDSFEEMIYNYFEGKKNETGITGLIAQAVSSEEASAVDAPGGDSSQVKPDEDEDR